MIFSAMILGNDWKRSYKIMMRDGCKTQSPNAGYPMAAIAGALGTRFEKIDYYSLGDGQGFIFERTCKVSYCFNESYIHYFLWNCSGTNYFITLLFRMVDSCLKKLVLSFHF